ncbi:MAG: alpha-galactosidase [Lachnospiraceae bacterium]|nr:alpha-galactosidase [Lachnospiraceae bacterium]
MSISYSEASGIFKLDTDNTTYMIGISPEGYAGHIYYGEKIGHYCGAGMLRCNEIPGPSVLKREKGGFQASFPYEYPTGGVGDYRVSCLDVSNEKGQNGCELYYDHYEISDGKPSLEGLPASFDREKDRDVQTLKLFMKDPVLDLEVVLQYSTFNRENIITRSVILNNRGSHDLSINRVLSACIDMDNRQYEMISLHGGWARERHLSRRTLAYGQQAVHSTRGVSSPQEHPFIALVTPGTNQVQGEVYAMNFVYSGNFVAEADLSQNSAVRMVMGIDPYDFCWKLNYGCSFTAPEVVMTYSHEGLGKMTGNLHDFYRLHLIRSPYENKDRPILINNWEGTYFDFNADRLFQIAKDAHNSGIEMFVMDDGWFGHRDNDNCGLGDWYVNESKLQGTLKNLVDRIKSLGMKFGIWVEPEMISPDSDLYRAHPDWALQIESRDPMQSRAQLVLDLSRKEIRDTVMDMICGVLHSADIDYVKWDMNRYLSDIGNSYLGSEHQGELYHRYVLGLYEMQERLITEFPELLFENCSSGGARFDAGMLYYSPQIWTSDDTDAIERLRIQEGTEMLYPMSTMGAHISKCPNEQVGRMTPFETRANVALAGTFGYELVIAKLSDDERNMIPKQVERYHKYHSLIANGNYYRIHSWDDDEPFDCWVNTAKDKSESLLTYVQVLGRPNEVSRRVHLSGLDPDAEYRLEEIVGGPSTDNPGDRNVDAPSLSRPEAVEELKEMWFGDELMNIGILIPPLGDFRSRLYHFVML